MKLILTRHGQTEENVAGIIQGQRPGKLTETGIQQARDVAKRLATEEIDFIYSSDSARAADTAREIAKFHPDTPLIFVEELRERSLGEFEGSKINQFKEDIIFLKTKTGESVEDVFMRAKKFLQKIFSEHPHDTVLFVSHGLFSKCLFAAITGKDASSVKDIAHFGNTSVSIFEIHEGASYEILCLNCMKHLMV